MWQKANSYQLRYKRLSDRKEKFDYEIVDMDIKTLSNQNIIMETLGSIVKTLTDPILIIIYIFIAYTYFKKKKKNVLVITKKLETYNAASM